LAARSITHPLLRRRLVYPQQRRPNLQRIYNHHIFLRMYWRALQELVNGPLDVANSGSVLMAKYNAFIQNGLKVENPTEKIESWLSQAQASIASQLAAVNAAKFTVNTTVAHTNNVAYISGIAPVDVAYVWIDGAAYPLTWTSLTGWTVAVPLTNGANLLTITGVNRAGQPIAGDSSQLNVNYTQAIPSPVGHVVINEIMYDPSVPSAQYLELYNNSTTVTYDLSGWQIQGLSYTFPSGSVLPPLGFLVLASNGPAFAAAYGATNRVFDTFNSPFCPASCSPCSNPSAAPTSSWPRCGLTMFCPGRPMPPLRVSPSN